MKKTIWVAIAVAIVAIGLASPLFYETSVDESLPGMLDSIEDGLTLEKFMSMDDSERQPIVDVMPDKIQEMIMQEATKITTVSTDDMLKPDDVTILSNGAFEGLLGHEAAGEAIILKVSGSSYLRFEDFQVTNGPDLRVYLTNDGDVKAGLHLEKLKGSKGNQNYLLDGTDWQRYDTVVIYCQPFGVHFGQAVMTTK